MFYGVYNFPDAPIRQMAGGYRGKGGRERTQEDFAAFIRWKKALIVVFPAAFGLGFAQAVSEARQRRTSHMTRPGGTRRPMHTGRKGA
jgi:hypothetical protein